MYDTLHRRSNNMNEEGGRLPTPLKFKLIRLPNKYFIYNQNKLFWQKNIKTRTIPSSSYLFCFFWNRACIEHVHYKNSYPFEPACIIACYNFD